MKPVIEIGYDSDAYEEKSFTPIINFFEGQGASVGLRPVLLRGLDLPSLLEITISYDDVEFAMRCFLEGLLIGAGKEAGKDAWKEVKKVLFGTKKHDAPELNVRIVGLQKLQIVIGAKVDSEVTADRFMEKLISIELDIKEMVKNVPRGLDYISLDYDKQKNVFEAKGPRWQEGVNLNMRFNFNTKNWEQERE